jgi:hypothetical protein
MKIKFKWKSIFRDIVPRRPLQDKLPKLTRRYSSPHGVELDPNRSVEAFHLMAHGAARSRQDAARLFKLHPDKDLTQILKLEKPKRRKMEALARSWERLKKWK